MIIMVSDFLSVLLQRNDVVVGSFAFVAFDHDTLPKQVSLLAG